MVDSQRHAAGRTWHPARVRPLAIGDKLARLCLAGQARTEASRSPPQKLRSGFPPNALPCADIPSARIHQPSPLPTYADLPNRRDTASACANTSSLVAPMRPLRAAVPPGGFSITAADTMSATQPHEGTRTLPLISVSRRSVAAYDLHSWATSFVPRWLTSLLFRFLACLVAAPNVHTWAMSPNDFVRFLNHPPAHGRAVVVVRNPVFVEPHNGDSLASVTYEY